MFLLFPKEDTLEKELSPASPAIIQTIISTKILLFLITCQIQLKEKREINLTESG
jgi:hypothetical protein